MIDDQVLSLESPFDFLSVRRSIIVWRLGGSSHIVDAEYGFSKKIGALCSFSAAMVVEKWNSNKQLAIYAYFMAISGFFCP